MTLNVENICCHYDLIVRDIPVSNVIMTSNCCDISLNNCIITSYCHSIRLCNVIITPNSYRCDISMVFFPDILS